MPKNTHEHAGDGELPNWLSFDEDIASSREIACLSPAEKGEYASRIIIAVEDFLANGGVQSDEECDSLLNRLLDAVSLAIPGSPDQQRAKELIRDIETRYPEGG